MYCNNWGKTCTERGNAKRSRMHFVMKKAIYLVCAILCFVTLKLDSFALSPLSKYSAFYNDARWKNNAPWGAKAPEISSWKSSGCCAYAADFVKVIYGSDNYTKGIYFTNASEIRAGDVIHLSGGNGHFFVVLNREGNKLCTAEGNVTFGTNDIRARISDSVYSIENGQLKGGGGKVFEYGYHWESSPIPTPQLTYVTPLVDGGTYIIRSVNSNKALEVPSGTSEKVDIQVWSYDTTGKSPWQTWICKKNGDAYNFVNAHTGQALDIKNNSTDEGAQLIQYPHDTSTNVQKFKLVDGGNGKYSIISVHSNRAVDVYGGSKDNGAKIKLCDYHGGDNQLWTFELLDYVNPTISNVTVSNITTEGYTVSCKVTDNLSVSKVQFPTWSENNGQDDLCWHDAVKNGDTYSFDVSIANGHNSERGTYYTTHIYAWDAAGNKAFSDAAYVYIPILSYLDINGVLDTIDEATYAKGNDLEGIGTVDVYINGSKVADDVTDLYNMYPEGTTYEINDIKVKSNIKYVGTYSGSVSGTVGQSRVNVWLKFETQVPTPTPTQIPTPTPTAVPTSSPTPTSIPTTSPTITPSQSPDDNGNDGTTDIYDISTHNIKLSKTSYIYDGKTKKPSVSISGLKKNTDYKVVYANNKSIGEATVIVKGIGNYHGTSLSTFTICPKTVGISSIKSSGKSITVKWKKGDSKITGYEIQYSLKKNSYPSNQTISVNKRTKVTTTIKKGMKKNKKYYVRIRTYKLVDGTKYYSKWSTVKSVKIK